MKQNMVKIKAMIVNFLKDPLFLKYWEKDWYSHSCNSNQLSVRVIGFNSRRGYTYKGDANMLCEDIYAGIMPFMIYRGEREKYPARIEPESPEKLQMIIDGISLRDHVYYLTDALCEFVRTSTQVMTQYGVVLYEIIYEKNINGSIKNFKLELIQPYCLFKFFKNYYQIIPWWIARQSNVKVQIIKIPAEKILRIEFPEQFGGEKRMLKTVKRLWQLSKDFMPKFYTELSEKGERSHFDLQEFSKQKYLEIAQKTKHLGWNQRKGSGDYISEYYSMIRMLRSKKVEATIRMQIILALNKVFNKPLLNLNVNIDIENIFTVEDVKKQEKLLQKGDVAFMDIFNELKI